MRSERQLFRSTRGWIDGRASPFRTLRSRASDGEKFGAVVLATGWTPADTASDQCRRPGRASSSRLRADRRKASPNPSALGPRSRPDEGVFPSHPESDPTPGRPRKATNRRVPCLPRRAAYSRQEILPVQRLRFSSLDSRPRISDILRPFARPPQRESLRSHRAWPALAPRKRCLS